VIRLFDPNVVGSSGDTGQFVRAEIFQFPRLS